MFDSAFGFSIALKGRWIQHAAVGFSIEEKVGLSNGVQHWRQGWIQHLGSALKRGLDSALKFSIGERVGFSSWIHHWGRNQPWGLD